MPSAAPMAAAATTYAVTTHGTSDRRPRSVAMVGSAVARIVWSRTAGSIASTMAAKGTATAAASGEWETLP